MTDTTTATPVGPVDGTEVPRFAGSATFARLPRIDEVGAFDVAVLGGSPSTAASRSDPARGSARARSGRRRRAPAAGLQPRPGRGAVRRTPGSRRRRRAVQPLRHRPTPCSRSTTASRSCWRLADDPCCSAVTTPSRWAASARSHGSTARSRRCASTSTPTSTPGTATSAPTRAHGTVFRRAHRGRAWFRT